VEQRRGGLEQAHAIVRGLQEMFERAQNALIVVHHCNREKAMRHGVLAVKGQAAWQRRGVGRRLMSAVDDEISRRGAPTLEGVVLTTNRGMLDFVQRLGFRVEPSEISPLFRRVVKCFRSG